MPRQPRLDAVGYLQHIIARGIERKKIFLDTQDHEDFLARLGKAVARFKIQCLAWVLMPNHVHLLLRSGPVGIIPVMRSVLTGYAVYFNRKYKRAGHLFQNRYKSIVCEEDSYLFELIRYLHLNPFRAGIVQTLNELSSYPWSSHAAIIGGVARPWHDVDVLLAQFGNNSRQAQEEYLRLLESGIDMGNHRLFQDPGESLAPRTGLLSTEHLSLSSSKARLSGDGRVLGSTAFVEKVLETAEKKSELAHQIQRRPVPLGELTKMVAQKFEIPYNRLLNKGKQRQVVLARSLLIRLGVEYLNKPLKEMARWVCLSESSACQAKERVTVSPEEVALLLEEAWKASQKTCV
ncbi:MAG: transposase [Elusimicrobia bacterium]|nr:transposase [Elusimicrobiota bacterium]